MGDGACLRVADWYHTIPVTIFATFAAAGVPAIVRLGKFLCSQGSLIMVALPT